MKKQQAPILKSELARRILLTTLALSVQSGHDLASSIVKLREGLGRLKMPETEFFYEQLKKGSPSQEIFFQLAKTSPFTFSSRAFLHIGFAMGAGAGISESVLQLTQEGLALAKRTSLSKNSFRSEVSKLFLGISLEIPSGQSFRKSFENSLKHGFQGTKKTRAVPHGEDPVEMLRDWARAEKDDEVEMMAASLKMLCEVGGDAGRATQLYSYFLVSTSKF